VIIDTSAVLAILFGEEDSKRYEDAIASNWPRRMSAISLLEATMVVESRGGSAVGYELDRLINEASIELVPVTVAHVTSARNAWRRFGKGNHPGALNFGDCLVYALADITGEPLLFKGGDFAQTDVRVVSI